MAKFSALLNDLHRSLDLKFKETQSKEQAKQLEDFFNYIVYGANNVDLNGILTKELADAVIKNNPELIERFKQVGASSSETGQIGEQAFANLIARTIEAKVDGSKIKIDTILGGQELTKVIEGVNEEAIEEVDLDLTQELSKLYRYYQPKQQKTDIKGVEINLDLSPEAQWLLELSATVKNYQSNRVTLGSASNKKALQAILASANDIPLEHKIQYQKMLGQVRGVRVAKTDQEHLRHIRQIYELTGLGQINTDTNELAKIPQYLMINQIKQRIVVRSTTDLVRSILDNKRAEVGFGSGRSISYKF